MIVGVGNGKHGPLQARGFAAYCCLKHIFSGQCSGGLMPQDEGILEEFDDLGFGPEFLGAVSVA